MVLHDFCCLQFFFNNHLYKKNQSVSSSLDPDQARHFVGPDLSPNYEQVYQQTADDISRQYNVVNSW